MSDSLIGKQLGDYLIRDLLGRGGMARVYTGYDARLDRIAAVKVINSDFSPADQAEYFERFQREARAIARLNHPNIVGVYQFGQYEDSYYMAMVFVEGRDLRQILREYNDKRELLPINDVLNVVRGIGSALDYAHSRGVIHRDIKPSNIMITTEGNRAILTDFGLALSANEGTRGETFGSAHYIAPEQAISSAKAVPQSDLYSLGICLYEMLTGKVPFDDPSAMTVALKHLQDPPPPPRSINSKLSGAVEHVLLKAIDKDPARRYPSGADLSRALEGALQSEALPDTSQLPISEIKAAVQARRAEPEASDGTGTQPLNVTPMPVSSVSNATAKADSEPRPVVANAVTPTNKNVDEWNDWNEVPPPLSTDGFSTERGLIAVKPPETKAPAAELTAQTPIISTPKRRTTGWLALLVVAIIVLLGGAYLIAQQVGLFGGSAIKTLTPSSLTAIALATQAVTSSSPPVVVIATTIATSAATESIAPVATIASTESPINTATATASDVPTATATPTATASETSTETPTATPTSGATSTADIPSPSVSPTLTVTPDAPTSPIATITAIASIGAGTPGATVEANDMLLLYNVSQLDLFNQSSHTIALNNTIFNQVGTSRSFSADNWLRTGPTLKPGECYQLFAPSSVISSATQSPHLTSPCLHSYQVRAFYGPRYADTYYFWAAIPQSSSTATEPSTRFTISYNGQVIATCQYSDGTCSFSLPKSSS